MRKNAKCKLFAYVLVFVLAFSMATISSFAVDWNVNPNLVCWTPYTVTVASGDTVNLQVVPASTTYAAVGFDSAVEAAEAPITWSVPLGSSLVSVDLTTVTGVAITINGVTKYAQQVTVNAATSGFGPASVLASRNANSYTNFSVVVPTSTPVTASNVDVYVMTDFDPYQVADSITVPAANYGYATPLEAIQQLVDPNSVDPTSNLAEVVLGYGDEYVESVSYITTSPDGTFTAEKSYPYRGWQYRVYRNGSMVSDSANIGAAAFLLNSNDEVVWYYNDYMSALTYFAEW